MNRILAEVRNQIGLVSVWQHPAGKNGAHVRQLQHSGDDEGSAGAGTNGPVNVCLLRLSPMKVNSPQQNAEVRAGPGRRILSQLVLEPPDAIQTHRIKHVLEDRLAERASAYWHKGKPLGILVEESVLFGIFLFALAGGQRLEDRPGCSAFGCPKGLEQLLPFLWGEWRMVHLILAPPLWEEIERMTGDNRESLRALRIIYGNALLNGPFSIIVGNGNYIYALNDRIKLRPLVAARKGECLFISSEEAPIRKVCPSPDRIWQPDGGEPVIGRIKEKENNKNNSKELNKGSSIDSGKYRKKSKKLPMPDSFTVYKNKIPGD